MEDKGDDLPGKVSLEVLDLSGRTLLRRVYGDCRPYMEYRVELENTQRGVYLLRFRYGNSVEVHQILVE